MPLWCRWLSRLSEEQEDTVQLRGAALPVAFNAKTMTALTGTEKRQIR